MPVKQPTWLAVVYSPTVNWLLWSFWGSRGGHGPGGRGGGGCGGNTNSKVTDPKKQFHHELNAWERCLSEMPIYLGGKLFSQNTPPITGMGECKSTFLTLFLLENSLVLCKRRISKLICAKPREWERKIGPSIYFKFVTHFKMVLIQSWSQFSFAYFFGVSR